MNFIIILLIFVVIGVLLHFTVTRPYRTKHDSRAEMLNSVRKGNIVYTTDGLRCRVEFVSGMHVVVSALPDEKRFRFDLEEIQEIEEYNAAKAKVLMDQKIAKNKRLHEQRKEEDEIAARAAKEAKREKRMAEMREKAKKKAEKKAGKK